MRPIVGCTWSSMTCVACHRRPAGRPVADLAIVVRSMLVRADLDVGRWMWWPSKLARTPDPAPAELSHERIAALTGA